MSFFGNIFKAIRKLFTGPPKPKPPPPRPPPAPPQPPKRGPGGGIGTPPPRPPPAPRRVREVIAHSNYGATKIRSAVSSEVHFFVDTSVIPQSDLTPERLQRALQAHLHGRPHKGFEVQIISWDAGLRSSADYTGSAEGSLNDGLAAAVRNGRITLE